MKSLSRNPGARMTEHEVLAEIVIQALERSFPEFKDLDGKEKKHELAKEASKYFYDNFGVPVTHRTIRYWLEGSSLPNAVHLSTLVMMQPKLFLGHWFGVRR